MAFLLEIPKEILVIIMAATPVIELRGAIPFGVTLEFTVFKSLILSLIGNMAIVPILLLIIEPLFKHFKRVKQLREWVERYESRAAHKISHYRGYRLIGLFLLVALPIPTTGAYTGCVAARVMKISFKNALLSIWAGVIVAGIIVYMVSAGTLHLWF